MSLFAFPHVTLHGTLPVIDTLAQQASGCSLEPGRLGSNPHSAMYPCNLGKLNALSVPRSVLTCEVEITPAAASWGGLSERSG